MERGCSNFTQRNFRTIALFSNTKLSWAATMDWTEEMTRTCILGGFRAGRSAKEIANFFGFPSSTVYENENDRWLAYDPEDVPIVMKTKFPSSIMVLGVISSKGGDVMPPHFFGTKETVTKEVYLRVLEDVIVPWMEEVSAGEPYVFQQNGAPAHTSNLVQNWLRANLRDSGSFWDKDLWPPSSPDCNPCDYFLWGVLERKVNATSHPNLTSLKDSIRENMAALDRDVVSGACKRFRSRLESVIRANGSYFE